MGAVAVIRNKSSRLDRVDKSYGGSVGKNDALGYEDESD